MTRADLPEYPLRAPHTAPHGLNLDELAARENPAVSSLEWRKIRIRTRQRASLARRIPSPPDAGSRGFHPRAPGNRLWRGSADRSPLKAVSTCKPDPSGVSTPDSRVETSIASGARTPDSEVETSITDGGPPPFVIEVARAFARGGEKSGFAHDEWQAPPDGSQSLPDAGFRGFHPRTPGNRRSHGSEDRSVRTAVSTCKPDPSGVSTPDSRVETSIASGARLRTLKWKPRLRTAVRCRS